VRGIGDEREASRNDAADGLDRKHDQGQNEGCSQTRLP
jgi:hypothetical protein